jgi:hypothetical protein
MLASFPLLAMLAGATPAASPLEGCTAERTPRGWAYDCGSRELSAWSDDGPSGAWLEGRHELEVLSKTAVKAAHGTAVERRCERRWERRRLGDADVEVLLLECPVGNWAFVALPRAEGARVLSCSSTASDGCDAVLKVLAVAPWGAGPLPGTRAAPSERLTLLGRPVVVPEGCTSEGSENGRARVRCGQASVLWFFAPDGSDVEARITDGEDAMIEQARGQAKVRDRIPCQLAGVSASCRRLVFARPDGDIVAFHAWAEVGGRKLVATCLEASDARYLSPCTIVFAFPSDVAARTVDFAGRAVPLPAGCEPDREKPVTRIRCEGGGFALWKVVGNEAQAQAALGRIERTMHEKNDAIDPDARYDRIPCELLRDVQATCLRVRLGVADGRVKLLAAAAQTDGKWVIAACMQGEPDDAGPCHLVLEVRGPEREGDRR